MTSDGKKQDLHPLPARRSIAGLGISRDDVSSCVSMFRTQRPRPKQFELHITYHLARPQHHNSSMIHHSDIYPIEGAGYRELPEYMEGADDILDDMPSFSRMLPVPVLPQANSVLKQLSLPYLTRRHPTCKSPTRLRLSPSPTAVVYDRLKPSRHVALPPCSFLWYISLKVSKIKQLQLPKLPVSLWKPANETTICCETHSATRYSIRTLLTPQHRSSLG